MSLKFSGTVWDLMLLRRLPGRVTMEQAGVLLGFNVDEMAILVKKGNLKPLNPSSKRHPYYFLTAEIEEKATDRLWMSQACKAIQSHWRAKNRKAAMSKASV